MKKKRGIFIFVAAFLMGVSTLHAQTDGNSVIPVKQTGEEAKAKFDAEVNKKAAEWVAGLAFTDAAKAQRVMSAIAEHLKAVRDWHNEHPAATVPAGINPATGNKLSELDRQVIASSAIPNTVHAELMTALQTELSPAQLEAVLDNYTIGKVAFTLKGYKAIVPDLTADEEAKILGYLKQAREQAIDYKSMKEISAIFEIYKTKCEQFLNSNGRNWRTLFRAYVDKVKKEKAQKQQNN